MTKKTVVFYFFFGIGLEFFRTFSMAGFTPYYINVGLSYEQIALVKAIQLSAWFLLELSAGYWADRFGRLAIFRISILTFGLSFFFISTSNLQMIILGELLYGISFALHSGTIIGDLNSKLEQGEIKLNSALFFARYGLAIQFFTLIGGNTGIILYNINPILLFLVPSISMISLYIISLFYRIPDSYAKEYREFGFKICWDILKNKQSLLYFLLSGVFIASSQIVYNYWAVLFNDIQLVVVFTLMMIASILGSNLLKFMFQNNITKTIVISFTIYCVPLLVIGFIPNDENIILLILFLISQFGRGMMFIEIANLSNYILYEKVYKSTVLSMNGTITRILSSVFLILSSLLFGYFNTKQLWAINAFCLVIVFMIFYKNFIFNKKKAPN